MKTFLVIATICCAGSVHAASMYKCVDGAGKVSYADHPCAPAIQEAWASRLGTGRLQPKQISPQRPAEVARIAPQTASGRARAEDARIEALRLDEMTRILGQHAAPAACVQTDAGSCQ